MAVMIAKNARHVVALRIMAEIEIGNTGIELKPHATFFQPFLKWSHHRVVLVVDGSHNPTERVEAGNHMSETHQIALKLDRAVPWLKSKGRTPHKPEVCFKERGVELVRNAGSCKQPLRLKLQAFDGENVLFAQTELRSVEPVSPSKETGLGRGFHR